MKFTARELLAFAAFIALALASMRIGGPLAAFTFSVIALAAIALLIVALVDRGGRRAFAIGFLVPLLAYAAIHTFTNRDELDPYDDFSLPTTRSFQPLWLAFRTVTWTDSATGKIIPDYDPMVDPSRHSGGGGGGFGSTPMVTFNESPDRATFTLLAHSIIAVALAIAGAKFATYIYNSQTDG